MKVEDLTGSKILQQCVSVLTYDLTPDCVAVRGVQLTQIKTLIWREETTEIHESKKYGFIINEQRLTQAHTYILCLLAC